MDVRLLTRQFLEWFSRANQNKTNHAPYSGQPPFSGGQILHLGPSSVALVPNEEPSRLIKIIKPGFIPKGLCVRAEYDMLVKLQAINSPGFTTPEPLSYGTSPDYLEMVRVTDGIPLQMDPGEAERIGTALGAFSAVVFETFGMVHNDICPNNIILRPNAPLCVIDIASLEQIDYPEAMFLVPLACTPNISPFIAAEFERQTGRKIDFNLVKKLDAGRRDTLLARHAPETARRIKETLDSNLAEWQEMLRSGPLRSGVRKPLCNRPYGGQPK